MYLDPLVLPCDVLVFGRHIVREGVRHQMLLWFVFGLELCEYTRITTAMTTTKDM